MSYISLSATCWMLRRLNAPPPYIHALPFCRIKLWLLMEKPLRAGPTQTNNDGGFTLKLHLTFSFQVPTHHIAAAFGFYTRAWISASHFCQVKQLCLLQEALTHCGTTMRMDVDTACGCGTSGTQARCSVGQALKPPHRSASLGHVGLDEKKYVRKCCPHRAR